MSTQGVRPTHEEHDFPFWQLSSQRFEQLCLWLLEEDGLRDVEHVGASGSDYGCDLLAQDNEGSVIAVQCKRYKPTTSFGPSNARVEAEKIKSLRLELNISCYLLAISRPVSQDTRETLRKELHPIKCLFWDATTLDRKVRTYPKTQERFFGRPYGVTLGREAVHFANATAIEASVAKVQKRHKTCIALIVLGIGALILKLVSVWSSALENSGDITTVAGGMAAAVLLIFVALILERFLYCISSCDLFLAAIKDGRSDLADSVLDKSQCLSGSFPGRMRD